MKKINVGLIDPSTLEVTWLDGTATISSPTDEVAFEGEEIQAWASATFFEEMLDYSAPVAKVPTGHELLARLGTSTYLDAREA